MDLANKEDIRIFPSDENISGDAEKLGLFLEIYQSFYTNRFESPTRHSDLIDAEFKSLENGNKVVIEFKGGLSISAELLRPIKQLLDLLSSGKTVTLFPKEKILTTQEAADLLGCSRQHIVNLCDEEKLECIEIGRHRRIPVQSLIEYKQSRKNERRRSLQKMTSLGQEIEAEIESKDE